VATFPAHPERRPAVVAGASSGLGAAIAVALGTAGYPVALGARRAERCEEIAEQIRAAGGEAFAYGLDVTDDASVTTFKKAVQEALGEVDIVVANAGSMTPGQVWEISPATLQAELDVNVVGTQRLLTAYLPDMVARRRGDFVFISSEVLDVPRPRLSTYTASKWGMEGLARVVQMELEGTGVRGSIVRPGPTVSEISAGWDRDETMRVVEAGQHFGQLRHWGVLRPQTLAATVTHVVSAPRGTHLALTKVNPEAPIKEEEGA
jgi:NADP-dependent 3-hydroxy acid dehydrogenase YdfG